MDTHRHNPPKLQVAVNGHTLDRELSAGGGDASLKGEPHLGKTARVKIDFPVSWLRRGDNEIRITTRSGSWLLYDWSGFYGPDGLQVQSVGTRSLVREIVPLHRLQEEGSRRVQPIRFGLRHFGEPTSAILHMEGIPPVTVMLRQVNEDFEVLYPAIQREKKVRVTEAKKVCCWSTCCGRLVLRPVRC